MTQATQTRQPFPKVDEVFKLTTLRKMTSFEGRSLDDDAIPARTTRYFKLVHVGSKDGLLGVSIACEWKGGKETNGYWAKVFNDTFGSNGVNPVGVPTHSWTDSNSFSYFPAIDTDGSLELCLAACQHRGDNWLWLVEVNK